MHISDGSVHDDAHHTDTEHTDTDVELLSALLIKKDGDSFDLDAPPTAATIVRILVDGGPAESISTYQPPPASPPFRLKPPLRGPPH